MFEAGIPLDALLPFTEDVVPDTYFDFFSMGIDQFDLLKAQDWYEHLVDIAPLVAYTRAIRVLLYDEPNPEWLPISGMLCIPRALQPNSALAFALFSILL